MEEKVDEAGLMKMASETVNQIDSEHNSTEEDCDVNNSTLKNYKKA